jgi:DNA-binding transcriptional regulator YiaG
VYVRYAPKGSPRFALRKPGQRRSDHGARRREVERRAYQAAWQKPLDQIECSAEHFYNLRRNVLSMNRKQAARLLRIGVQSVLNWENGVHPVPFGMFCALSQRCHVQVKRLMLLRSLQRALGEYVVGVVRL